MHREEKLYPDFLYSEKVAGTPFIKVIAFLLRHVSFKNTEVKTRRHNVVF
jgi:hypothetical protein